MPRFFFDLVADPDGLRDDEGTELSSIESAISEATDTLLAIYRDHHGHRSGSLRLSIRNEAGTVLATVAITVDVQQGSSRG
jgi:hypothetical protein